ncbi:MAG: HAD-IA family hydrolase [Anaerovibrio sp.]|uniref:HAD-IA family hydrolase n=1 Tax=Anaerovibrio sp. TaxID=1872532 RepID=UPI00262BA19B|nr:HAD-IA family hydrolase [Anaerovibrio sp.]MDD7678469.1 HAD-IA family hydrolase [Anaerovibrio sp.]MDY2603029.1 HAD-IA family hydrolase [Anaerovibrio sp.]
MLAKKKHELYQKILREDPDLKPIDGIPELLDRLKEKGYRIGLGSSSVMANIQLVLGRFGILDYFDAIAAGSEVENAKPAPDVYLLAASRLGIAPENCTVVEDATAGIAAAKAAGMRCIAVRNPNSGAQDFSQADVVIDRYDEIKL